MTIGLSRSSGLTRTAVATAFLLVASACNNDDGTNPPPEDPSVVDGVPTNVTTVEELVDSYAASWAARSHLAMDALLGQVFEFFILAEDSEDLAWVTGGFWNRAMEMEMATNMSDPNYIGNELPVESIQMALTVLNQDPIVDANDEPVGVSVTADCEVIVLVGRDEGWFADTRFLMDVIPDELGFQRLSRMQEIRALRDGRAEDSSWGSVKALYR